MNKKNTFLIGIVGVSLLFSSFVLGGLLIENYDILKQYISESYAIDTKHGIFLRVFGYIPSGIMIFLFCFFGLKYFSSE